MSLCMRFLAIFCLLAGMATGQAWTPASYPADTKFYPKQVAGFHIGPAKELRMPVLNPDNPYGQNTLRMFRFDDGSGNLGTDYSPAAQHATVANATWVQGGGLLFDATGETCSTAMPSWGNTLSVFIRFKSQSNTGSGAGKFCCAGENDGIFQINRDATVGDTGLRVFVNSTAIADRTVPDLFDMAEHTMLVAFNQSSSRCSVFVDGVLCGSTGATFTWGTLSDLLGIGNRPTGSQPTDRPLMATVYNFYMWDVELGLSDAQSLHADPDQMFLVALEAVGITTGAPVLGRPMIDGAMARTPVNRTSSILWENRTLSIPWENRTSIQ